MKAEPIRAAGRFVHEAALFHGGVMCLTEDQSKSGSNPAGSAFYRYVPDGEVGPKSPLHRSAGVLQALRLRDEPQANMDVGRVPLEPYPVEWVTIDEPDHDEDSNSGPLATRNQARAHLRVARLGRAPGPGQRRRRPEDGAHSLQEDGSGEQFMRGVGLTGQIYDFARTTANTSEFCGGCFDPHGQILFVNQQGSRGSLPGGPANGGAVTYAIWGPWKSVTRTGGISPESPAAAGVSGSHAPCRFVALCSPFRSPRPRAEHRD